MQVVYHEPEIPMPCLSKPCGVNSVCEERNGVGSCSCMKDYFGDPYIHCRPECVLNTDCISMRACINSKCVDVCSGACGLNSR